jgi:hypothetical protein
VEDFVGTMEKVALAASRSSLLSMEHEVVGSSAHVAMPLGMPCNTSLVAQRMEERREIQGKKYRGRIDPNAREESERNGEMQRRKRYRAAPPAMQRTRVARVAKIWANETRPRKHGRRRI